MGKYRKLIFNYPELALTLNNFYIKFCLDFLNGNCPLNKRCTLTHNPYNKTSYLWHYKGSSETSWTNGIDLIFATSPNLFRETRVELSIFEKCHHNVIYGIIDYKVPPSSTTLFERGLGLYKYQCKPHT